MKLPELHQLLKVHKIKGLSHLNKPELIAELTERGILPKEIKEPDASIKLVHRRVDGPVEEDQGDVVKYPSIYKAAKAYAQPLIAHYDGRVWRVVKYDEPGTSTCRSTSRKQPRPVEILDRETGEVVKYPSIYKAARAHGQCSTMITYYNGRVWKDRYEIKVC